MATWKFAGSPKRCRRDALAVVAAPVGWHTTEFFTIDTGMKPLRADHTTAKPQLVLPLEDL
jgi:hypothetical protein